MTITVRARTVVAGAVAVVALVATGAVAGAALAPRIVAPATAFPDVPAGAFYTGAVQWAKDNGITTGVGDTGLFQPDANVTRGQMVTFLERLASTTIVIDHAPNDLEATPGFESSLRYRGNLTETMAGVFVLGLPGPRVRDGIDYGLQELEYCIDQAGNSYVDRAQFWLVGTLDDITDDTDRTADGCYTVTAGVQGPLHIQLQVTGTSGFVNFTRFTTTWVPVDQLVPTP